MIFLKTIKAHGFKSFANPITINFNNNLIGIVGPNGSGKSNINDAIRWVMGEQSAKQLRGDSMEDVIFNGSDLKKPMNMAEVTLIFLNHDRRFSLNFAEISITRRIYRSDRSGEYLINGERSRLKDVQKLAMEAGISKSSLSIISQGTVTKLAEAKPEELRDFLDEAAGVSKYKKHKQESLRKLMRTNENLEKISLLVNELEIQVKPLEKQANKASEFLKYKKDLEKIEVALLAQEIKKSNGLIKVDQEKLTTLNNDKTFLESEVTKLETKLNALNQIKFNSEKEINNFQKELNHVSESIQNLEIELVRREESAKNKISNSSLTNNEKEIKTLEREIKSSKNKIDSLEERIKVIEINLSKLNDKIINLNKLEEDNQEELNNVNREKNIIETKIELLNENLKEKSFLHPGVKIILKHKESFKGIYDILMNLIDFKDDYKIAIENCLSHNFQYIVCQSADSAQKAVAFLKRNRAGKATFLPINNLIVRHIKEDDNIIIENSPGFINFINNLIEINSKYKKAIDFLTNRIILVDNLKNAIELSKRLKSRYRIVTLEGDLIFPGGTINGGFSKSKINSNKHIKNEIEKHNVKLKEIVEKFKILNSEKTTLNNDNLSVKEKYQETYALFAQVRENHKLSLLSFERLANKYEMISENKINDIVNINDGERQKVSILYKRKDTLVTNIQSQRNNLLTNAQEVQKLELKLTSGNSKIRQLVSQTSELKVLINKLDATINSNLLRLNNVYKLTFEHAIENYQLDIEIIIARKQVNELILKIEKIGNVNIDAISRYAEVKERYDHLLKNSNEIKAAKLEIEKAIKSMDELMLQQFSQMIIDVRLYFAKTFKVMFSGGKADLKYSDPENILDSGIEIIAQPPGKTVKSLTLFSGGEKSLIVISLLFAILESRHLPLVILDEAEAPLDEANVARYGSYLKNFAKHTQFIVVTHRPGTMECMEVLYGATMQSAGITKMVSVKLKDAIELSEKKD